MDGCFPSPQWLLGMSKLPTSSETPPRWNLRDGAPLLFLHTLLCCLTESLCFDGSGVPSLALWNLDLRRRCFPYGQWNFLREIPLPCLPVLRLRP